MSVQPQRTPTTALKESESEDRKAVSEAASA